MNIGVCVSLDSLEKFERQVAAMAREGIYYCQILSWNMELRKDEYVEPIKAILQKYGVTPSAFWCGWEGEAVWDIFQGPATVGLVPEKFRELRVKNICDGADFARKLGITDVITHMGFIPECPNDPSFDPLCDAVRRVAAHLKENGQYFLFETGHETPAAMLRCIERVGADNLGVNHDTSAVVMFGKANAVDALNVLGPWVRNLHVKDGVYPTSGFEPGKEVRMGEGAVDFDALFTKLRELGFDSHVTFEREPEPENLEDIRFAKTFLENAVKKIYG